MTAKEALETLTKQLNLAINGSKVDLTIANESRNIINKALTELEAIKSADGGEAMEYLNKMFDADRDYGDDVGLATGYGGKTEQMIFMENFILKSQAQEIELVELKKRDIAKKVNENTFIPVCPTCGAKSVYGNFCDSCGQRLDWSEE